VAPEELGGTLGLEAVEVGAVDRPACRVIKTSLPDFVAKLEARLAGRRR
jgi:hypothetical protein